MPGKRRVVFGAAPGAPFSNKVAPKIARELERLEKKYGAVTPEALVKEARAESSIFHNLVTWETAEAARLHRLQEARCIINHVLIRIYDGEELVEEFKGWHSVKVVSVGDSEPQRVYVSLRAVTEDEDLQEQVLDRALRELDYWKMRYGQYKEFAGIRRAINETTKRMGAAARKVGATAEKSEE